MAWCRMCSHTKDESGGVTWCPRCDRALVLSSAEAASELRKLQELDPPV